MNRIYYGERINGVARVWVATEGGDRMRDLDPRLDLANRSPSGLEWGYGGSGPAQLALALLADATGDDGAALALHQDFKWRFVARFDRDQFEISQAEICRFVGDNSARMGRGFTQ